MFKSIVFGFNNKSVLQYSKNNSTKSFKLSLLQYSLIALILMMTGFFPAVYSLLNEGVETAHVVAVEDAKAAAAEQEYIEEMSKLNK